VLSSDTYSGGLIIARQVVGGANPSPGVAIMRRSAVFEY